LIAPFLLRLFQWEGYTFPQKTIPNTRPAARINRKAQVVEDYRIGELPGKPDVFGVVENGLSEKAVIEFGRSKQ
jgi:hypothetical protein